jgi:ferredoxin
MAKGALVDEHTCIGCGLCAQLLPGVYEMQATGKSVAVNPSNGSEEEIENTISSCPVHAITWKEYEGEASSEEAPANTAEKGDDPLKGGEEKTD